jgi:hypothetical protein
MLRMCVYMHSRFVENHPIRILEDIPLISEGVLSHGCGIVASPRTGKRLGSLPREQQSMTSHHRADAGPWIIEC